MVLRAMHPGIEQPNQFNFRLYVTNYKWDASFIFHNQSKLKGCGIKTFQIQHPKWCKRPDKGY
jgi:hypothetical protein